MKVGSKPISSPSRAEKFPPPLMSFLRSNVGSKSRGKSRSGSGPLFFRKRNVAAVSETQEPSSPKVTCMGQVRVRRSARTNLGKSRPSRVKCPTLWFPKNMFCNPGKSSFGSFRPVLRKWVSFFRFGYCRKVDVRGDSPVSISNRRSEYQDSETGETNGETETEVAKESFVSTTPPKNAFLLTRCRSAPYRSSSLASRFLGSPLTSPETEENLEYRDQEKRIEEVRSSINGRNSGVSTHSLKDEAALLEPLILTRCKSEPARTGARLINQ